MAPLSGKQRKAQLKLKRAIKRGDVPPIPEQPQKRKNRGLDARIRNPPDKAIINARKLQSQFVKLDKTFLDGTRTLAGSIILRRPIPTGVTVLRHEWLTPSPPESQLPKLAVPKRPKWRYQMSKEELDANEQAYFRTWLAQQDAIVEQWQRALNPPSSTDQTSLADLVSDRADDSETYSMPHPPTHFERNIEVWRQFWRVTEISQILLVLLDSRCPLLHLPFSLSERLDIPTSAPSSLQNNPKLRSRQSNPKTPRIILVLTKVDISGPARTASWTSFLNTNYPGVPVVPVEAYAPKCTVEQGPTRYEPHLPGTFRERLVHTLRDVHERLLQPPQWVTAPRLGESEEERLQRTAQWRPKVKRVIDWGGVLTAKGELVGKAVGGAAVPKGQDSEHETKGTGVGEGADDKVSDSEEERTDDASHERKEPEFLTIGVIGQPNVGKSSLLNAIFGKTRVRASRTPGKTKHFQTLFWTSDVRLVDCPGLVMPSFVPMDIQVLSGVLPISRIAAVPFCVHQLARLLPLEQILELAHPSISIAPPSNAAATVASSSDCSSLTSISTSNAKYKCKPAPTNEIVMEDKRTWRPGHHPVKQASAQTPRWTANDIMTAYADKKGWVTAKAGRSDIHRAGNAILRLVAEGKIPWAFWSPGSSASSDDGIWLKDGVQQHAWDEGEDEDSEEQDLSEMEGLSSEEEDTEVRIRVVLNESNDKDEDEDEDDEKFPIRAGNLGRFGALRIE